MARLLTTGFETGAVASEHPGAFSGGGTPVFGTGTVRSGARSLEIQTASSLAESVWFVPTMVANRDYFLRTYLDISANPANACYVLAIHNLTTYITSVRMATNGTLGLFDFNGTQVGSSSAALTPGVQYRVELRYRVTSANANTGTLELLVNGAQVAVNAGGAACGTAAPWAAAVGLAVAATSTATFYFDDVALNDDQGAGQTSWPGDGKVVLLKPISDNARAAGWLAGAGGTTNLWDAVNNVPPVGVVLASATDTSQIKNSVNTTTQDYDANLETYATAGLVAGDTVTLVQGIWNIGDSVAVIGLSSRIGVVSNPTIADASASTPANAAGTFPTDWATFCSAVSYLPAVTLGTSPVLRFGKNNTTTNALMCDLMGLYVEYNPGRGVPFPPRPSHGLVMR